MKKNKYFFVVLILLLCAFFRCGYEYFVVSSCYDLGQVWDEKNKRCRSDCLTISKINGCIRMTKAQTDSYKKTKEISDEMWHEICLNNDLPEKIEGGYCDVDFSLDNCEKLDENIWYIPKRCKPFRM